MGRYPPPSTFTSTATTPPAPALIVETLFSRTLRCSSSCRSGSRSLRASRDSYVTFTRKTVLISSYQDDAIQNTVETWADAVASLD